MVRGPVALAVAGAAIVLSLSALAGCGGDDDPDTGGTQAPPPVASPEDFPKANGKTLAQLRREVGKEGGPILAPSVSQLEQGPNRFGFGLFDRARAQIRLQNVGAGAENGTAMDVRGMRGDDASHEQEP